MNSSVYMFGVLSSGYTQYPDDSTSIILKGLYNRCKAPSQVVIHRDGSLMYYSYIRKLEEEKYIGLSVVVNGLYLETITNLFKIYESTIENLAELGDFIHYANNGMLVASNVNVKDHSEDLRAIIDSLKDSFNQLGDGRKLPPVDFSVAKDSAIQYEIGDLQSNIVESSYTYGYTFIYKSKDYNTVRMNRYMSVLSRINSENESLKKENHHLIEENAKVLRKKKQFKNVVLLMLLLICCGIGLYFLNNKLSNTQGQLTDANNKIATQESKIYKQARSIEAKSDSIASLKESRREYKELWIASKNDLSKLTETITNRQSLIITQTSINWNTGYLTFYFYGLEEKTLTLTVRTFGDNGYSYVNSGDYEIKKGNSCGSIYAGQLNSNKWYSFVLMVNGVIVGGGRH